MKKFLFLAFCILMLSARLPAQNTATATLSAAASTCATTNVCLALPINPNVGGVTFTVSANASSNTIQFEATANGGATWVALNATPSNSATAASSTTSTGTWQANVAGYTSVRVRMSSLVSGTTTVTLSTSTASARAGGGGGGSGTVTSVSCGPLLNVFTCSVANPTTTPALSFAAATTGPTLQCDTFPGAPDMGVQVNNCLAALPADGGIADATHFTSPQRITTPIVNNVSAVIETCGIQITQTALITLSGNGSSWVGCPNAITTITKGANIDQFELSGTGNQIQYLTLNGDRAGAFTGNGVTLDGGIIGANVLNLNINSEDAAAINDQGSAFGLFNNISISDYGVNAIVWNGTFSEARNLFINSPGTETGPAIVESGSGSEMLVNDSWFLCNGTFACIDVNTNANLRLVHTYVSQTVGQISPPTGYSAILVETGAALQATGSCVLAGGGTGNATVQSTSTNSVIQINGCIFDVTGGGDGVVLDGGQGIISNNSIQFQAPATGQAGVRFSGAPVAGGSVTGNYIVFPAGETPSGDNYGVWLQPPAMGGFRGIKVSGNSVEGTGNAHDFGYFFDNGNANGAADRNIFANNTCVDTSSTGCIKRTDSQNLVNLYTDNFTTVPPLFISGGSTNDVIVQHAANSIAFAGLPTAGVGSMVECTDCQMGSIVAAGGQGGPVYRQSTIVAGSGAVNWTGNTAVVGQDTHTAEITGNYGPIILVPSTAPSGNYLVTIYTEVSTSVATSTITASIAYADDTGAQTQTGALFSGATAGTIQSLTFPVRFVTGTALTYSTTTANSPKYKITGRAAAQ